MGYKTIKDNSFSEIVEKKSRFISNIFYVETKEEAEKIIRDIKRKYNDASHNVYAYRLVDNSKFSDDGEPSGTAGAPLLNALEKLDIVNVLVIVTRYFGGTLLGTGGLVRAYTKGLDSALKDAGIIQIVQGLVVKVTLGYNEIDNLNYYCKQNGIEIIKSEYLSNVEILLKIEKDKLEEFKVNILKKVNDISACEVLNEITIKKFNWYLNQNEEK